MELINWVRDYSVNIQEIDRQHQELIHLINQLLKSSKMNHQSSEVTQIFQKIEKYITDHLKYEEKLLQQYEYPEFKKHKQSHDHFVEEFLQFKQTYLSKGNPFIIPQLGKFLMKWLVKHIKYDDKEFAPFLTGKGLS